jgi:anti-sigma regulatory factor (Ser/Thr protein kinase)
MIGPRRTSFSVKIDDPSRVGEARRRATALAAAFDFDATRQGAVALVVAEAASNLARHARGGELLVQARRDEFGGGLEVTAVDRGPGMRDIGRCLGDGYSTAGSLGTGLGTIARIADEFAIDSRPGRGTVVWSRLGARSGPRDRRIEVGAINLSVFGEEVCGDDWDFAWRERCGLLMVADGLGHGPTAAEAAEAAVEIFRSSSSVDPVEIIEAAHFRLRSTRGAALAVARLDLQDGEVAYAGVGNIAGVIAGPAMERPVHLISQHGTAGHAVRKIQEYRYPWPTGSAVVLHSDGLSGRWDLGPDTSPTGLAPGVLAGLLYRDYRRERDDVTVVVARRPGECP